MSWSQYNFIKLDKFVPEVYQKVQIRRTIFFVWNCPFSYIVDDCIMNIVGMLEQPLITRQILLPYYVINITLALC